MELHHLLSLGDAFTEGRSNKASLSRRIECITTVAKKVATVGGGGGSGFGGVGGGLGSNASMAFGSGGGGGGMNLEDTMQFGNTTFAGFDMGSEDGVISPTSPTSHGSGGTGGGVAAYASSAGHTTAALIHQANAAMNNLLHSKASMDATIGKVLLDQPSSATTAIRPEMVLGPRDRFLSYVYCGLSDGSITQYAAVLSLVATEGFNETTSDGVAVDDYFKSFGPLSNDPNNGGGGTTTSMNFAAAAAAQTSAGFVGPSSVDRRVQLPADASCVLDKQYLSHVAPYRHKVTFQEVFSSPLLDGGEGPVVYLQHVEPTYPTALTAFGKGGGGSENPTTSSGTFGNAGDDLSATQRGGGLGGEATATSAAFTTGPSGGRGGASRPVEPKLITLRGSKLMMLNSSTFNVEPTFRDFGPLDGGVSLCCVATPAPSSRLGTDGEPEGSGENNNGDGEPSSPLTNGGGGAASSSSPSANTNTSAANANAPIVCGKVAAIVKKTVVCMTFIGNQCYSYYGSGITAEDRMLAKLKKAGKLVGVDALTDALDETISGGKTSEEKEAAAVAAAQVAAQQYQQPIIVPDNTTQIVWHYDSIILGGAKEYAVFHAKTGHLLDLISLDKSLIRPDLAAAGLLPSLTSFPDNFSMKWLKGMNSEESNGGGGNAAAMLLEDVNGGNDNNGGSATIVDASSPTAAGGGGGAAAAFGAVAGGGAVAIRQPQLTIYDAKSQRPIEDATHFSLEQGEECYDVAFNFPFMAGFSVMGPDLRQRFHQLQQSLSNPLYANVISPEHRKQLLQQFISAAVTTQATSHIGLTSVLAGNAQTPFTLPLPTHINTKNASVALPKHPMTASNFMTVTSPLAGTIANAGIGIAAAAGAGASHSAGSASNSLSNTPSKPQPHNTTIIASSSADSATFTRFINQPGLKFIDQHLYKPNYDSGSSLADLQLGGGLNGGGGMSPQQQLQARAARGQSVFGAGADIDGGRGGGLTQQQTTTTNFGVTTNANFSSGGGGAPRRAPRKYYDLNNSAVYIQHPMLMSRQSSVPLGTFFTVAAAPAVTVGGMSDYGVAAAPILQHQLARDVADQQQQLQQNGGERRGSVDNNFASSSAAASPNDPSAAGSPSSIHSASMNNNNNSSASTIGLNSQHNAHIHQSTFQQANAASHRDLFVAVPLPAVTIVLQLALSGAYEKAIDHFEATFPYFPTSFQNVAVGAGASSPSGGNGRSNAPPSSNPNASMAGVKSTRSDRSGGGGAFVGSSSSSSPAAAVLTTQSVSHSVRTIADLMYASDIAPWTEFTTAERHDIALCHLLVICGAAAWRHRKYAVAIHYLRMATLRANCAIVSPTIFTEALPEIQSQQQSLHSSSPLSRGGSDSQQQQSLLCPTTLAYLGKDACTALLGLFILLRDLSFAGQRECVEAIRTVKRSIAVSVAVNNTTNNNNNNAMMSGGSSASPSSTLMPNLIIANQQGSYGGGGSAYGSSSRGYGSGGNNNNNNISPSASFAFNNGNSNNSMAFGRGGGGANNAHHTNLSVLAALHHRLRRFRADLEATDYGIFFMLVTDRATATDEEAAALFFPTSALQYGECRQLLEKVKHGAKSQLAIVSATTASAAANEINNNTNNNRNNSLPPTGFPHAASMEDASYHSGGADTNTNNNSHPTSGQVSRKESLLAAVVGRTQSIVGGGGGGNSAPSFEAFTAAAAAAAVGRTNSNANASSSASASVPTVTTDAVIAATANATLRRCARFEAMLMASNGMLTAALALCKAHGLVAEAVVPLLWACYPNAQTAGGGGRGRRGGSRPDHRHDDDDISAAGNFEENASIAQLANTSAYPDGGGGGGGDSSTATPPLRPAPINTANLSRNNSSARMGGNSHTNSNSLVTPTPDPSVDTIGLFSDHLPWMLRVDPLVAVRALTAVDSNSNNNHHNPFGGGGGNGGELDGVVGGGGLIGDGIGGAGGNGGDLDLAATLSGRSLAAAGLIGDHNYGGLGGGGGDSNHLLLLSDEQHLLFENNLTFFATDNSPRTLATIDRAAVALLAEFDEQQQQNNTGGGGGGKGEGMLSPSTSTSFLGSGAAGGGGSSSSAAAVVAMADASFAESSSAFTFSPPPFKAVIPVFLRYGFRGAPLYDYLRHLIEEKRVPDPSVHTLHAMNLIEMVGIIARAVFAPADEILLFGGDDDDEDGSDEDDVDGGASNQNGGGADATGLVGDSRTPSRSSRQVNAASSSSPASPSYRRREWKRLLATTTIRFADDALMQTAGQETGLLGPLRNALLTYLQLPYAAYDTDVVLCRLANCSTPGWWLAPSVIGCDGSGGGNGGKVQPNPYFPASAATAYLSAPRLSELLNVMASGILNNTNNNNNNGSSSASASLQSAVAALTTSRTYISLLPETAAVHLHSGDQMAMLSTLVYGLNAVDVAEEYCAVNGSYYFGGIGVGGGSSSSSGGPAADYSNHLDDLAIDGRGNGGRNGGGNLIRGSVIDPSSSSSAIGGGLIGSSNANSSARKSVFGGGNANNNNSFGNPQQQRGGSVGNNATSSNHHYHGTNTANSGPYMHAGSDFITSQLLFTSSADPALLAASEGMAAAVINPNYPPSTTLRFVHRRHHHTSAGENNGGVGNGFGGLAMTAQQQNASPESSRVTGGGSPSYYHYSPSSTGASPLSPAPSIASPYLLGNRSINLNSSMMMGGGGGPNSNAPSPTFAAAVAANHKNLAALQQQQQQNDRDGGGNNSSNAAMMIADPFGAEAVYNGSPLPPDSPLLRDDVYNNLLLKLLKILVFPPLKSSVPGALEAMMPFHHEEEEGEQQQNEPGSNSNFNTPQRTATTTTTTLTTKQQQNNNKPVLSRTFRKRITEALELLERHAGSLDPTEVLSILPTDMPVANIAHFLKRTFQTNNHKKRLLQVIAHCAVTANFETELKLNLMKQRCIYLDERRCCVVCRRPIGDSVFAVFPNLKVAHFPCFKNASLDPERLVPFVEE